MENQKYTMGDIEKFLIDYKECNKYNSKDWLISIPIIGTKFYRKVILENMKITFFEKMYKDVMNGNIEQQNKFISEMTTVLDDFYADKEKRKTGRR